MDEGLTSVHLWEAPPPTFRESFSIATKELIRQIMIDDGTKVLHI